MEKKKGRPHPLVLLFIIMLCLMLLLCSAAAALWLHGRAALEQHSAPPELPPLPQASPEPEQEQDISAAGDEGSPQQDSSRGAVYYEGKKYRYNEGIRSILLMGIDSEFAPDESLGSHVQADVLVLAVMDTENNKMTLISISRDTVCEFPTGDGDGSIEAQIALSYAYGDGGARSCELSCQAVSNIFYGLPIHGYGAFFMEGIAALNDAVGGVTLTILDDYPFWHMSRFYRMWPGQELTLTGEEAEVYVRARLEHQVDANELRMARQKQFLLAAIEAAKQKALENPTAILGMYDAVDEYIITDLDIAEISYLASRAVTMDFAGDLRSLEGELLLNEDAQAELHPDEEALFRLMLEVFYVEEEEN